MASHIQMFMEAGGSRLDKKTLPEFEPGDFPAGWVGLAVEDSGIFMFMFNIAADAAEFPIHASEDAWLAYVVSGSGTLYAGTADSERTGGVEYEAGDFITFEAGTPHGWKNGAAPGRILFAKCM